MQEVGMNGAAQERDIGSDSKRVCVFPGFLRVRNASDEELCGFPALFAEPDRGSWVAEAIATGRAKALVVERFAEKTWDPVGFTVTAPDGETALALRPHERRRGLAHEALRAAVRVLREEPFAELSACIDPGDTGSVRTFERAGFAPAGSCRFRGRPSTRYVRNLRGDCMPFNVWI
jgi:RimJ/RimL family protein N-acetyltransferase